MAGIFRKLRLLVWKNIILQIRRPIGTIVELILPIAFLALLVMARVWRTYVIDFDRHNLDWSKTQLVKNEEECFSAYKHTEIKVQNYVDSYRNILMKENENLSIAFYPITTETSAMMENVAKQLSKFNSETKLVIAYNSTSGIPFTKKDDVLNNAKENDTYLGAITFDNVFEGKPFPKRVEYSIRLHHSTADLFSTQSRGTWFTRWVYPFFQQAAPTVSSFYLSPFLSLQYCMDTAILQHYSNNVNISAAEYIEQLPYPDYIMDTFIQIIQGTMPTVFILAYMYTAVMIVKELVAEKQLRLKESMKMMGLANWIHWTAWFIKIFLFLLISIICQTAILKGGKIFEFAETSIIFIFLLLYFLASIFFLFFCSAFFSNAIRGMLFAAVLWFGSLGPYLSFSQAEKYEELSSGNKFASCLLPNTCLGIIVQIISRRETSEVGVSWSNIAKTTSVDDNFTLAEAFSVLVLDCVVYSILTWYIENVFPGDYGIPRPFYFPFQPSYWCGIRNKSQHGNLEELKGNKVHPSADFEDEPEDLRVGVSIKDLLKVFNGATGKKVAVDGLTLNMYKGQITALLGHNGAGKTTTMSILTGLYPPSGGDATVNGRSIYTDMDVIRESLGLCPQHNVLFDRLTVKEHLEFFSALKNVPKAQGKVEIEEMITDIQLKDKADQKASTLSGGMKRKLCCAIALLGGSETVFLDEPTSGMDPYARRATWDLLQKYRANKTIILTTHFMDEADHLGDRIAIMAEGQLRCCGSSLFLKKRYGVGYHMTLVKGSGFEENKTRSLVAERLPTAKIVGNVGLEMSFVLNEDSTKHFKGLFEVLEDKKEEYGISSFGISVTTLEEVFLKVGEGETLGVDFEEQNDSDAVKLHNIDRSESMIARDALLTGCALKLTQFKAMFVKRFLNSKREKKAVVTQILLPLLLVLCGLLLSLSQNSQEDDRRRELSLSMLNDAADELTAFYTDGSSASAANKNLMKAELKKMSEKVFENAGVQLFDVTSKMNEIRIGNTGDNISLLYSSNRYIGKFSLDNKSCCNYKYLVLNEQCRNIPGPYKDLCGTDSETFAYGNCMNCINTNNSCGSTPSFKQVNEISDTRLYFQEYILEDSGKNVKKYFNNKVAGFTVEEDGQHTVWYSNQAWHTIVSAFSTGSNVILKFHMNDSDYGIITYNHPLPRNTKEQSELITSNGDNLTLVIFVTMASCFIAASFITFIVTEKTSKAKHIQFVSGVDSISYWGATYCWDFINFLVPAIIIIFLFLAFDLDDYDGVLGEVFFVMIMFGVSILPFVYVISFIFQSALIGYAVMALLLMVISLAMVIAVFILVATENTDTSDTLHLIFLILPTYAFPKALSDIASNLGLKKACTANDIATLTCQKAGRHYEDNMLAWKSPGVGVHCFYMFIEAVFFFLLTLLIEKRFFLGSCFGSPAAGEFTIREGEDVDVCAERERVFNMSLEEMENSAVVVKDLTKVYRTTGMTAVDHLNVSIPKAECFGLLGVNGAGKTTTFGMLTGELGITAGTAYMHGYNIQSQLNEVQQRIGYCPQFDALVERLTGREMLTMFARLRGIPSHLIDVVVKSAIEQLNLGKWADKLCGDYSGGNKRKLSTAMALVGDPQVVFLDEPTSGMDPASRRFLWNTLTSVINAGRSIVLTSHSMEECEALCTRLVIMVNGQFKCIGSIQHLKSRFGQGYTVMMKVSGNTPGERTADGGATNPMYNHDAPTLQIPQQGSMTRSSSSQNILLNSTKAKEFMVKYFPGAVLVEDRQSLLQYQIINPNLRWSQMFGTLEEHAQQLGIIDYSVSQTSLEQVFINFAKNQLSEDRIFNKGICSCSCF